MTLQRILFILIFLLGIALRVIYLITPDLNSDQAVIGLMARHILDGEFPIFYWGEHYAGPIESYFASIIFYIFGSSPLTLSLSPFIFSLIFIFLVYRLGKEMFNEKVGLMAMLLVSVSPPFLIWYSISPSGNYIHNLVFGTLLLLMTFRFVNIVSDEKTAQRYYIVIGFVGGLAWWVNFQIIHFLLTTFIFMFLKDKWSFIKRGAIYLFPSFMIGSSLFWYYNLKNSWGSIDDIQRYSQKINLSNSLITSFDFRLPFVLGPFANRDTLYLGKYFIIVFGVLLLYFVFTYRRGLIDLFRLSIKRMTGAEILMVFFIIFSVVIISRYNFSIILRYYLPIYSVFPIILAASIYNTGRVFKPLPALLVILFAASNIFGDIKGAVVFDSAKLKSHKDSKERDKVFFESLSNKGIKYVAEINYWRSFKLTFDSVEEVIFALPTLDWRHNKYPAYTEGLRSHSNPAFMWRGRGFEMILESQGISFVGENYFNYNFVYHSLKLPEKKGSVIPASTMIASSNYDEIDPKSAIDRDVTTEWTPLEPKDEPPYLEIDMKRPYLINRVSILNGGSFDNSPPSYELEVSPDREVWSKVISIPVQLGGFVSKNGVPVMVGEYLVSVFDPIRARYVRIKQPKGPPHMEWQIAEMFIYSPSESISEDNNPSYLLGLKYFKEKRWEEAMVEFSKVVEGNPDSEDSHYQLWLISKELGLDTREDLYYYGAYSSAMLNRLVRIYEKKGDIKKADFFREKIRNKFSPVEQRSINFGGIIEFMGYNIKHGSTPEIVYYWKAMKDVKKEWYAFIHFIGPDGKIAFQNDHLLFSGGKPGSKWVEGEYYKTQKRFLIDKPEDLRPGTYSIRLGIWDPKTGKRLKVNEGLFKRKYKIIIGELRVTG